MSNRTATSRASQFYKPKTAKQYEKEMLATKKMASSITDEQKRQVYASTIFDRSGAVSMNGWRKVGQQFIGPILVRLRYEGVVRDLLVERPLAQGQAPIFPVKKDIGVGYVVQGNMGEVRIHRFEGTRVTVPMFRVSSRPMVTKADVYQMDFDLIASVKDDAFMMIREEEDGKYFGLIESAVTNYEALSGNPSHTINVTGDFVPSAYHTAAALIADERLKASRILTSAGEYYDFFGWGTDQLGWKARDVITETGTFARYGDMMIKPSIAVPTGTSYVQPDEKYVGFMPVQWSLDATPVDEPEKGLLGFVYDEMIGMLIANPNGLVRIRKA